MAEKKNTTVPVTVRIDRLVNSDRTSVKAVASANIGEAFAIHGIQVVDSVKGAFVRMPQTSYKKNGKTEYSDTFHPVTAEARADLYGKVLEAYEAELAQLQKQSGQSQTDQSPADEPEDDQSDDDMSQTMQ